MTANSGPPASANSEPHAAATGEPPALAGGAKGRLLGVDYGQVRVGLAISDPERIIASPLVTYTRTNTERDATFFRELVRVEGVVALVVGLPVHLSGREGEKAVEARTFGAWLAGVTGLPLMFWDERFTTREAESHLKAAGLSNKRRKDRRDRVAAQILLQTYIAAGCPGEQAIGPLDV